MRRALLLVALTPLAACAHGAATKPADVLPTPQPPNARAKLYADCLGESARAGTYERFGRYLRLTCTGAPGEAMFAAMETFSRARDFVAVENGVETRSFSTVKWDDHCLKGPSGAECRITVPVGSFLDPAKDIPPPDAKKAKK